MEAADTLRELREASRRRLRGRVGAIVRAIRAPLAEVLRDHALIHLPPAAAARLRLVHPSWSRTLVSPLFAIAHAAAPRRASGLFAPTAGFLPFDRADMVPSPSVAFLPAAETDHVAVLSSSRGLACCFSLLDNAYFVCNPATARWTGVPSPPRRTWPRPAVVVLFDASAYNFRGDYTLVSAFESAPGSGTFCFSVFSSGTGSWWVPDAAVAPADGLVPASGVAAGGTAWWRTSIGTVVGFNPVTGQVEIAVCPTGGSSGHWEIGSVADRLHCAVLDDNDGVAVFRLDGHGLWEEVARVAVEEILPDDDDDVRLLPFQGAEMQVVVLAGRRVVAFDTVTRRRREVALPDPPEGRDWSDAEYTAHTNTLAMVAPAVLACEPALTEPPPDDREAASSSS